MRKNGITEISVNGNAIFSDFSNVTKSEFVNQVKLYNKGSNKNWKVKDIEKVAGIIWEEEKDKQILEKVEDGFQTTLFDVPVHQTDGDTQNIFFLHGAFHIYEDKNKIDAIQESKYLSHCLNKLKNLSGNIVIIGSSLDENDKHIFDAINQSNIEKIYVSVFQNFGVTRNRTTELFSNKEVYLFDAETISYSMD